LQRLGGALQARGVLERLFGVVDRARPHDREQALCVAPVDDVADFAARGCHRECCPWRDRIGPLDFLRCRKRADSGQVAVFERL